MRRSTRRFLPRRKTMCCNRGPSSATGRPALWDGDGWRIRPSGWADLEEILAVYARARAFMREHGNRTQWAGGHPARALVEQDIAMGTGFVLNRYTYRGRAGRRVRAFGRGRPDLCAHRGRRLAVRRAIWLPSIAWPVGAGRMACCARAWPGARSGQPHLRVDTHADNASRCCTCCRRSGLCAAHHPCGGTARPRIAFERLPQVGG